MERAFLNIFTHIVGSSGPVARLRAAVWQSIFTCNFDRYRRGLSQRMRDELHIGDQSLEVAEGGGRRLGTG